MINPYEVPAYLTDRLPEIKQELKDISPRLNIYKSIQCLADFTKKKVLQHDLLSAKKCSATADYIYTKGNNMVRKAIENVFVFSLSTLLNAGTREEKNKIQALMPLCLHTAYIQQVLKPGV